MKFKNLFIALILFEFFICCTADKEVESVQTEHTNDTTILRTNFKKYFENCNVKGSIVIYDNNKRQYIVSDTTDIKQGSLPASTFKIINLLIALETKTIANENEIIKWVGKVDTVKYGFRPEIYHDMTVKEAFEVSAGWVFIELAKKIGREKYKKYLSLSKYGNINLSQNDDDFWNFGAYAISPKNQVEFLKKLFDENLPFSKSNMIIVKKVMVTEQTNEYTIRAKTGWTRENNINTGWWIGYLENSKGVYFFATRLTQDRKYNTPNFGSCRKEITKAAFKELGLLKQTTY